MFDIQTETILRQHAASKRRTTSPIRPEQPPEGHDRGVPIFPLLALISVAIWTAALMIVI